MTPGTQTGPGESNERLDRRKNETTNHGEQVRWTSNFCQGLRTENRVFRDTIHEFHQGKKTKEQLKELFKKELKDAPEDKAKKMGLSARESADIDNYLSQTGCFENQMMFQINADKAAKQRANQETIDDALGLAQDEYGNFDQTELKNILEKDMEESPDRIKLFLESSKFRKSIIKKLPGSTDLITKNFNDINFDEITKKVGNLVGTDVAKRREIQEAWLKITSIAQPGESLAEAFARVTASGAQPTALAGAYEAFFGDTNTLISKENKEKILNFLTRQYIPTVPFDVVESVDPASARKFITNETDKAIIESNITGDEELKKALIKEKKKEWERMRKGALGNTTGIISTHHLPFGTKIRLLSQFGSIGKAEQMTEYYRGRPESLHRSTVKGDEYLKQFQEIHGIEPDRVETQTGLVTQLEAKLGKKIHGLENFNDNCVMQWKTKYAEGNEKIGYYIIDSVLSDDLDAGELVTMRFLGDNRDPLSPAGIALHYSGADFYNYLSGCSEDGNISFTTRDEFEKTMKENEEDKKLPRYIATEETYKELREKFPESIDVPNFESFNNEVDNILNPRGDSPLESKNKPDREIHEGMVFVCGGKNIDTFQIKSIGENEITLWDGWGTAGNSQHEQTLSFQEFILVIKNLKAKSGVYRLNTNQKPFSASVFNTVCTNKDQYAGAGDNADVISKKFANVRINKVGDSFQLGKTNEKNGSFEATSIIKLGAKKDICIESISEDGVVRYRQGTFTQSKFDKTKNVITQKPVFKGTGVRSMSLSNLWAYMYNNSSFQLETPKEEYQKEVKEDKNSGSLSWWNILMHTHSLGVILHGDLWKAPFKAWEEQHHKDHAFAGKMTTALAAEKLQTGNGPVSHLWNKFEFPSLMVADGNSSFHSYLDELIEKIDGMGSFHRTRLIKKWSTTEHFPSVKFMAAMMASMKIFGHLYPYDFDGDYSLEHNGHKSNEWFWYNSICHSLDPDHKKYDHMPPHHGKPWPKKWISKAGFKMNETEVCNELFGSFQHPMLKNLGRRFQKYMNGGQEHLASGGKGNLEQRTSMEEKREWMMSALCSPTGKLPEGFGDATELWLVEGYPKEITSMPYAALLFSGRDKLLMQPTREHIRNQFQNGYHMPLFCFMQEQDQGELFREAGVVFAYTISMDCGKKLEKLIDRTGHGRLAGSGLKNWTKDFEAFWMDYGKEMMDKIAGMRDPMLQLIVNDPAVYDEMLDAQPPEKRAMYDKVREKRDVLRAFHGRIAALYDSPSHCGMKRDKGYYSGDNFRFRDAFPSGFGGLPWYNWDAYIDENLTDAYGRGEGATTGDGVFNEFRAFLYAIPKMAKNMVEKMGFTDEGQKKKFIDKISRSLHKKTIDGVGRLMEEKIKADKPDAEYCSMTAMMFELIPIKKMTKGSSNAKEEARFERYFDQMHACLQKAKEIENDPKQGYAAALDYREKMAGKWRVIVKKEIPTDKVSIEDIYATNDISSLYTTKKIQENIQARSGEIFTEKLGRFEEEARVPTSDRRNGQPIVSNNKNTRRSNNEEEAGLAMSA